MLDHIGIAVADLEGSRRFYAAALAPLDFCRLLLASFTGFVFFAEIPALTTWAGAAIVIGATLYTIRKNARTTVPPPATA